MTEWKPGDTVTFALTGTIAKIAGPMVFIDTHDGTQYIANISQILGTPAQAKRDRMMAILKQEFSAFDFYPIKHSEESFHWVVSQDAPIEQMEQWIEAIRERTRELYEQL